MDLKAYKSEIFSVSFAYDVQFAGSLSSLTIENLSPPKELVFSQKILQDRFPSRENMSNKRMLTDYSGVSYSF